jgi:glycosyltransferase involved in cell wall biosynthesis
MDYDDPTFSKTEIAGLNNPRVKVVVTTTEHLRDEFIRHGVLKPIEVVPSGFSKRDIDERLACELARIHNPHGYPVIGYCGSTLELPDSKPSQGDLSLLIKAMQRIWTNVPNTQLWLIGNPSNEVAQWARKEPRARLFGLVPRSRMLAHLQNFTVATYPRRLDHGGRFSIKLIEYMGLGIPIVATPVSETEMIRQAEAGIFAETPEQFADAILKILHDNSQKAVLSENALRFSVSFDWDVIAKQYEDQVFLRYCS